MSLIETQKQEIDYNASKLITQLAGRGKKGDYDSFKGTEVMEFFRLLWVHEDLVDEEIKRMEKNKNKNG